MERSNPAGSYEMRLSSLEDELSYLKRATETDLTLSELYCVFLERKWLFIKVSVAIAIIFILIAVFIPKTYKASTVLAQANDDSSASARIPAQYGGLAAMAGVSLGDAGGNRIEQGVELIQSWPFWSDLLSEHAMKHKLLAVVGESRESGELEYDLGMYNPSSSEWVDIEPSDYRTYRSVVNDFKATYDSQTGMLELTFIHLSPTVAFETVSLVAEELNQYFKEQDKRDAQKSIALLTEKIAQTKNTEMRMIFYNLIEAHTKTLLLTDVRDEYLVKTLVRPMVPESGSNLKRIVVAVLGFIIAVFIGATAVIFDFMGGRRKAEKAVKGERDE